MICPPKQSFQKNINTWKESRRVLGLRKYSLHVSTGRIELFEGIHGIDVVLMLLKKIYGLKNTAKEFWRELLREFSVMGCGRKEIRPMNVFQVDSNGTVGMIVMD